jgi:hypothetical protein
MVRLVQRTADRTEDVRRLAAMTQALIAESAGLIYDCRRAIQEMNELIEGAAKDIRAARRVLETNAAPLATSPSVAAKQLS